MLTLDADALSGRELELLIIVEQPAVLHVKREHHARHEARHKIGEAESERQQSHDEALPFVHREEVDEIITTDDAERGGKMATFVLSMLDNTALVADSIGTYVWALRWKMKLSHQADPVLGVMHWQDLATMFLDRLKTEERLNLE